MLRAMLQLRRFCADHQAGQRCVGLFCRVAHTGDLAAAQHGAGIAQLTDLVQFVRNIQNTAALRGQLFEHHKQLLHRLRGQHRGGLVQNQQLRVGQQGTDDFHPLHLTHAQGVHRAAGVDVQAVFGRLGGDAGRHLLQALRLVQAQPHVLRHGDGVKQVEVLEHHADAQRPRFFGVADIDRLAVEQHLAGVGLDGAVNDLHQGGLAGTVFAEHGVGLAGQHGERYVAIGDHARVGFGDACQLQPRDDRHGRRRFHTNGLY